MVHHYQAKLSSQSSTQLWKSTHEVVKEEGHLTDVVDKEL